jgi:glucose/arabinose dehydrogenase
MSSYFSVSSVDSVSLNSFANSSAIASHSLGLELSQKSDQSIVFVDSTVEDIDRLTAGIQATVVRLDSTKDGVEEITAVLAQYRGLSSVQIISHGSAGDLQLGNTHLNQGSLNQYADRLQQWGQSLSSDGDLLFYGCNVAAASGKEFIQQVSQLTGADVQASDDLTGMGGDWDLEVAIGSIEAKQAIGAEAKATYEGTLASRNGQDYIVIGKATWKQAQAEARRLGGNLVSINSKGEEKFLKRTFGTQEKFWTGLSDRRKEGQFQWADGEAITYRNWQGRRQPANTGQDFTVINAGRQHQWDDRPANAKFRGIVEIPQTLAFNGSRYRLTSNAVTYSQAWLEAQRLGGKLVTFDDSSEKAFLKQNFPSEKFWTGEVGRQPSSNAKLRGLIELPGLGNAPLENSQIGSVVSADSAVSAGPSFIELERNSFDDINETDGVFEFAIVRKGDTSQTVSASFQVSGAGLTPAILGTDYEGDSVSVVFAPTETRKTVQIKILDDQESDGKKTFAILLEGVNGVGVKPGTVRTAKVNILDNESDFLDISVKPVVENAGNASVKLTRSNKAGFASVNLSTADGTAIAGSDYEAFSQTITFADGESSKTIPIRIINDGVGEPNETFKINFSNPVGVSLGSQTSLPVTITDDDATGLTRDNLVSGLFMPTSFDHTPTGDRMYIFEKGGVIKTAPGTGGTATVFADLSRDVNDTDDRGGLSIAVHPKFYSGSPYIYVSYTYDPPEAFENRNPATNLDDPDQKGNRPARVVRLTADASTGYTTVVAGSQVVIVGKNSTWDNISSPDKDSTEDPSIRESGRNADGSFLQDYVKTDSVTHTIGQVRFGPDGNLYVSIGDGSSYLLDQRAASSLNIDSLSGKMLRLDPLTGQGLNDNPYYNGDPNSNRSKVWQSGIRNSFRFTFKPGDNNTIFLGDVGWNTWEEVNVGGKGANFGWPAYEGTEIQPQYNVFPETQAFISSGQTVTQPVYSRNHADGARAVAMGDFYNGQLYVSDVNEGVIEALTFNAQNQLTSVQRVMSGMPYVVQMRTRPDGLYFVDLVKGEINRFRAV